MAETAKALGIGNTLTFEGKEYKLSPFTWGMVADVETWLEDRAWSKVERMRDVVPDDLYQARLEAVSKQIASGAFGSGSKLFAEALRTTEGHKRALLLMLRANDKSVTPDLVERIFESHAAEAMARVTEANADPNPQAAKGG